MTNKTSNNKKKPLWKKILITITSIVILVVISGFSYEAIASYQGVKDYPPEGKMVDAGEFKLHLQKQGEGKPTIILEAGSGASSLSWNDLPEELAKYGTVVTYDRGGYAWSEEPTTERTGENIVKELYTALKNEKIEGPYILVGHSLGGMYVRLFAQTYKEEVGGVILLDGRPEDYSKETDHILEKAGVDPILLGSPPKHVLSLLKQSGIIRLMKDSMLKDIPEEHRSKALNVEFRTKYIHAKENEMQYITKLEDSIRSQSLGDLPLSVVTHGIPIDGSMIGLSKEVDQKMETIWQEQQTEMLKLSTNSELIIANNSGHAIMHDEPELVVDVVRNMIEKVIAN